MARGTDIPAPHVRNPGLPKIAQGCDNDEKNAVGFGRAPFRGKTMKTADDKWHGGGKNVCLRSSTQPCCLQSLLGVCICKPVDVSQTFVAIHYLSSMCVMSLQEVRVLYAFH